MTLVDYAVVMAKRAATPVRFDVSVATRLAAFVAVNPGLSLSSAANLLVDEALRTNEHPGIIFKAGPTGRRAALASGPDIWEIVRGIKSARAVDAGLTESELYDLLSENTGIGISQLRTAVRYWAVYPDEIDAEIAAADAAEDAARESWQRERKLLAG
jgi:hypothetical protein